MDNIGGAWIIFPIIMIPTMLIFMYFMFMRSGGRRPWQDSGGDYRGPGPYREPPAHHEPGEDRQVGVPERPLDILNRRYAAGEITKEEFDQMKQDLA